MKSYLIVTVFGVLLCAAAIHADCTNAADSDDGDVTAWFKNIGCKIKEGANDVKEAAKPIAEKIGQGAKDFGSTVAQKYDEIKHKLTDDEAASTTPTPILIEPTAKIPLAPLGGNGPAVQNAGAAPASQPAPGIDA